MVKGVKARKKTRRKWNKTIGILLCITAMGTIITLSALNQKKPSSQSTPKPPAEEYFSFSEVAAIASASDPQNMTILVSSVNFKITPIAGNATNVLIYPLQGGVAQEDSIHFDEIINGTSVQVSQTQINYNHKVSSEKVEGKGWPLLFRITCNECDETKGEVTVYVTEFYSIPTNPSSS